MLTSRLSGKMAEWRGNGVWEQIRNSILHLAHVIHAVLMDRHHDRADEAVLKSETGCPAERWLPVLSFWLAGLSMQGLTAS